MTSSRLGLVALLFLLIVLAPETGQAFCGFFVSGASAELYNNASQVVLLRNGSRTVMTMSNNYKGPPQDFAMVVPVPVVLQKDQVKTVERDVLRHLDELSAPRLVEYWEQDPCNPPQVGEGGIGLGTLGLIGHGGSGGYGAGHGVKVEARFAVGEYNIVVLSAQESGGLERWLHDNHYNIPKGAAAALAPYVRDGMKFFVAKVDITKVVRDRHGLVVLSPLRFSYDSPELRLPVRLGLLNAQGPQDLLIYLLHPSTRLETANYKNVFVPTNLELSESARDRFGSFYGALFDETLRRAAEPAVVTEYAWDSGTCDPCPGPPLSSTELYTLGAAEDASKSLQTVPSVVATTPEVRGPLDKELVRRIVRRHINEVKFCYERELFRVPTLQGVVTLEFVIKPEGSVGKIEQKSSTLGNPAAETCIAGAVRRWEFPKPQGAEVTVTYPFTLKPELQTNLSRGLGSYVLTRLHARYDQKTLAADLIFREAPPVEGGRAGWGGKPEPIEAAVRPGGANNFQGRYIIRHYWQQPVTCQKPVYGNWGGPPGGGKSAALPALDLANTAREGASLGSLVLTAVPALGIVGKKTPARSGEGR